MSDDKENKSEGFAVPYPVMVEAEQACRQKNDFWRLRTIAIVLRQTPAQIKSFEERYPEPLN